MQDGQPRVGRGNWLRPPTEVHGAVRYVDTVRERWWLVAVMTLIALLAAIVYLTTAPTRYKAEADLLVTPVSGNETASAGLGLITASNDPTQTVSTAARLVDTNTVAAQTLVILHRRGSPQSLLSDVKVEPIAQSSLVAVEAERGSALEAAQVANTFAATAVNLGTVQLHATIASQLPALQARLKALPPAEQSGPGTLGERIVTLEALASAPNPTLRVASRATPPTSPSSPRKKLTLIAALLGGLIVGLGGAFASQALDPRLRREDQLRSLFRLPLLARIPRVATRRGEGPLVPSRLTPAASEAFRTLRSTITASVGEGVRSILVTSSAEAEGKSSAAINLAESFALAGRRTLLIEGDMRRPTIARALDIRPRVGIGAVLVNDASMDDAVITTPAYGPNLGFLLVERNAASLADRLSLPTARKLVADAEGLADIVIIDSPPLTQVIDALPIAQEVDAVVLVARVGVSRLSRLANLGEILVQGGVEPAGFAVIGDEYSVQPYYSTSAIAEAPVA